MIIGQYPCCGEDFFEEIPPVNLPSFCIYPCPNCGTKIVTKLSKIDPESWILSDFEKIYVIDEKKKTIQEL